MGRPAFASYGAAVFAGAKTGKSLIGKGVRRRAQSAGRRAKNAGRGARGEGRKAKGAGLGKTVDLRKGPLKPGDQ